MCVEALIGMAKLDKVLHLAKFEEDFNHHQLREKHDDINEAINLN